jgi:hypothetical protein
MAPDAVEPIVTASREEAIPMLKMLAVPPLSISPDKVCHLVVKVREFETKDEETDPDSGSNPSDDRVMAILEEHGDDAVADELKAFIDSLNEDEQTDLVALAWLGRDGDATLNDWPALRREAILAHNDRTAAYLLGMPLLPDYLEEALALFGRSCQAFEAEYL